MWSILFHYEGISVVLGLAAMLLPVICLFRKRRSPWAALLSLSACTSAVLLQIWGPTVRCGMGILPPSRTP